MYRVQLIVELPIFYKHVFISIAGTIFTEDPTPFGLVDIDINIGMNWLHTHRTKTNCNDGKVSLRGEKPLYSCFMNKP